MPVRKLSFRLKDGRPVTIRRLRDDDLDGLVAMFASLSKEALQFGLPPYDRPRLERWVTGLGGGVILLALDGTNVIGVAMVFGRVMSRLRGVGEFVIYVHQDYQHQGLGTFLTKTVLEEAKKKGFHRVGLEVVADNTAAVKAYKRAGFAIEGRLRDAFFGDDGVYHEQLVMAIIL